MKESTRNIFKMHGWRVDRAVHNYIYFVFYDIYVVLFLFAGRMLKRFFSRVHLATSAFGMVFERYHAKVITIEDATKILTLNEDVILGPDKSERIVPYQYANKIILKEPEFIAVMDCPCRKARGDAGCRPLDVCMAVGRTTAQFWLEHGQRFNAHKITQEEALQRLKDARDRGNITTAFFKVATGGRTGVICSCCTCCCGALEGERISDKLKGGRRISMIVPSSYVPQVDAAKCVACGKCVDTCFFEAISLDDGTIIQSETACRGCGLCVEKCPSGARSLRHDPAKGDPLDIDIAKEKLG